MAGSWGPRRILACALVGLGGFAVVGAVLIPTFTVGKLAKTPLDLEITTVATTPAELGAEVLDARSLTSPTGSARVDKNVPLVSQRFLTVEDPSDAKVMTVQAGQTLRRTDKQGDTGLLSAIVDRVTIDRKSGEPVDDPIGSVQVQADKPADEVAHTGLQYRFPFGAKRQTYPYFDVNARETYDMNFIEATEVNTMPVYHFAQKIAPVDLSKVVNAPTNKLTLPAAKWGVPGGQELVTMTRWYSNQRDLWVDPKTGVVVKGQEKVFQFYGRSANKPELTVLKADITFDENTIESQIAKAKDGNDKLSLYGRILPIVLGLVGVLSLVGGAIYGATDKGNGSGRHQAAAAAGDSGDDAPTEVFPRI